MEFLTELGQYIANNYLELLSLTGTHILMVAYGIGLALVVGVPLGVLAAKREKIAPFILSITNILQLVPSLAMLAIVMLYLGLGMETMVVGIFFYSLLPIVRNTYVGIKEVEDSIVEAGIGVGMTSFQLLTKIQFPLSIPFLMAGLRVAVVIAVSVACLGPYIGAEGLGQTIISGINFRDSVRIVAGVIPASLLAIFADLILGRIEKKTKRRLA